MSQRIVSAIRQLAMTVLWPAFLVAAMLEGVLFVVVDPHDLRWFGGPSLGLSLTAAYSITFLILWAFLSLSSWLTAMMLRNLPDTAEGPPQVLAGLGDSFRIEP